MNITEQDWFKKAVEIAGPVTDDDGYQLLRKKGGWCWHDAGGNAFKTWGWRNKAEAEAAYEKHFREWLEARDCAVEPDRDFDDSIDGYEAWAKDVEGSVAAADTYLECQCRAVAAVGKDKQ